MISRRSSRNKKFYECCLFGLILYAYLNLDNGEVSWHVPFNFSKYGSQSHGFFHLDKVICRDGGEPQTCCFFFSLLLN